MLYSYFKIACRNLLRKKVYSLINIGGLALGMTVACLIGLWIADELSFNQYHQNYHSIAQVYRKGTFNGGVEVSMPQVTALAHMLKTTYGTHFKDVTMMRGRVEERLLAAGEKKFTEQGYFVQANGPQMFSLKMVAGSIDGLQDVKSIIISQSLADKLFKDGDALNEIIIMDGGAALKVTGVYEDLPKNSEFSAACFFAPLELYVGNAEALNSWDNYFVWIYVQLHPGADHQKITAIIQHAAKPYTKKDESIFLHPMSSWHLNSEFENGVLVRSKAMMAVWSFAAIGAFVLLLACINFMNLSTARSESRAKEVGIRKTMGSIRVQLIQQFYSESFLVAIAAFFISLCFVQISLPWFNSIADKAIVIPWSSAMFWCVVTGFVFFSGILAGSYPALYLSSFNPVKVLKRTFKTGRASSLPRKVLVVVQFTVSIALATGTMIIYRQIQFAKDRPVGYSRNGLIEIRSTQPEYRGKYDVLRTTLKNTNVVEDICQANYSITDTRGWNDGFSWKGREYEPSFNTIFVTPEYGKTIGWEFVAGRDFSREIASDSAAVIVNESALAILGIADPIGENLKWSPGGSDRGTFTIVGVVKDMVKGSPYDATFPSIIFSSKNDMGWMYIRMKSQADVHTALAKIERVLSSAIPSAPFEYTFADEAYAAKFRAEERMGVLAGFFSSLAILISLLGLFGLASFVAEQRTKEIGIRKVLGATIISLWQMLSKDFVTLVLVACAIATPLSLYCMNAWLRNYAYRIEISSWIFVGASAIALMITLLIVSLQTFKAALTNPVQSLRSE